ncbi:MAG: Asp-tRNA(Asn)/Glu-tRNA(Gln) amidotransferase subunit GatC [Candidatus Omnitrophota bacterium]|jgi:aspartyl-tRNA(Asn)/glutamyl-tRNA(Gln) amidotransferase subunit C
MADTKNVEYVARLAKIEITDDEKESLGGQLTKIIKYIDKLKTLNTDGIEPMRGLHPETNAFREDKAILFSCRKAIIENSPSSQDGYFKVPNII